MHPLSLSVDNQDVVNIKELNKEIENIVLRQNELRTAINEIVVDVEGE